MAQYNILGIDTSNYTTSVAVTDQDGEVLGDRRRLLKVKKGERGLRQSEALFQHISALPELLKAIKSDIGLSQWFDIAALAVSVRPRPVEGSYMPCFLAGQNFAKVIAESMNIPIYECSHQEGHIEAIKRFSEFKEWEGDFLTWHLSGGTCELLKVLAAKSHRSSEHYHKIDIVGGSRDISFGQLLDRAGVALGYDFPAGAKLDKIALNFDVNSEKICKSEMKKAITPIKCRSLYFNLSGTETQAARYIERLLQDGSQADAPECKYLIWDIFEEISKCLRRVTEAGMKETGISKVIFAGGVSGSQYIQKSLKDIKGGEVSFGNSLYATDNGVGVSLLGGKLYGNEAD